MEAVHLRNRELMKLRRFDSASGLGVACQQPGRMKAISVNPLKSPCVDTILLRRPDQAAGSTQFAFLYCLAIFTPLAVRRHGNGLGLCAGMCAVTGASFCLGVFSSALQLTVPISTLIRSLNPVLASKGASAYASAPPRAT